MRLLSAMSGLFRNPVLSWSSTLCLASLALLSSAKPAQAQLSPAVEKQIHEIYVWKGSLSPAEKKMSSNLALTYRIAQGKNVGNLAKFASPMPRDSEGRVEVEVTGYMTPSLLTSNAMKHVEKVNGLVPVGSFRTGHVRTHVKEADLLELANNPDVQRITEPMGFHTNVGSITSQGYVAQRANAVVASGVTGAGVKVGVLSDSASATRVAALIASGDLPANTVVLPGQAGSGEDEGTAMMEIVHDMAPGAQIFFASAFGSESQFATNIRTLRYTYGCDIIVDGRQLFRRIGVSGWHGGFRGKRRDPGRGAVFFFRSQLRQPELRHLRHLGGRFHQRRHQYPCDQPGRVAGSPQQLRDSQRAADV